MNRRTFARNTAAALPELSVLAALTTKYQPLTDARRLTAHKVAARLGLPGAGA